MSLKTTDDPDSITSGGLNPIAVYEGRVLTMRFDADRLDDIERVVNEFLNSADEDDSIYTSVTGDALTVRLMKSYII